MISSRTRKLEAQRGDVILGGDPIRWVIMIDNNSTINTSPVRGTDNNICPANLSCCHSQLNLNLHPGHAYCVPVDEINFLADHNGSMLMLLLRKVIRTFFEIYF